MSTRFSLRMEMSRLTRDGTAELVSRDQILSRERGQGNTNFPCSADHAQDWLSYPVDPYSCYMCDHTQNSVQGWFQYCYNYWCVGFLCAGYFGVLFVAFLQLLLVSSGVRKPR